jgi:hypothetical protein
MFVGNLQWFLSPQYLLFTFQWGGIFKRQIAKFNQLFFFWLALTEEGIETLGTSLTFMAVGSYLQALTIKF